MAMCPMTAIKNSRFFPIGDGHLAKKGFPLIALFGCSLGFLYVGIDVTRLSRSNNPSMDSRNAAQ